MSDTAGDLMWKLVKLLGSNAARATASMARILWKYVAKYLGRLVSCGGSPINGAAMAVVVTYLRDKLSDGEFRRRASECLISTNGVLQALLGICNWFFSLFKKGKKPVEPALSRETDHSVMESVVQGSLEATLNHRPWECFIVDGKGLATGKGLRIYNFLVMPEHVLMAAKAVGGVAKARGIKTDFEFDLTNEQTDSICCDVVAIKLSDSTWSQLSVAQVSIGFVSSSERVSIVGVTGKGTTEKISVQKTAGFGLLVYNGTTLRGYSGATYSSGGSAFAMHLSGSPNIGVALDYLRAIISKKLMSNNESRDEDSSLKWATEELFDTEGKVRKGVWTENFGREEMRVFSRGRYHILDKDTMLNGLGETKYKRLMFSENAESVFPISPSGALKNAITASTSNQQQAIVGMLESSRPLPGLPAQASDTKSSTQKKKERFLRTAPETVLQAELQRRLESQGPN